MTQCVDLPKSNKRAREEVETEDEIHNIDAPSDSVPTESSGVNCDSWNVSPDGQTWKRIHRKPRCNLYIPVAADQAPVHLFAPTRTTEITRPEPAPTIVIQDDWTVDQNKTMGFDWVGSTTFHLRVQDEPADEDLDKEVRDILDAPVTTIPSSTSSPPPMATTSSTLPSTLPHEDDSPSPPPDLPADTPGDVQQQPPQPEYRPQPDEDFKAKRARYDLQETISYRPPQPAPLPPQPALQPPQPAPQPQHPSPHQPTFGPQRRQDQQPAPHSTTSPYGNKPSEDSAVMSHDVEVDLTSDNTHLPPGWHFEDGYIVMDAVADEWQIKGNYLIRRHYLPRDSTFDPTQAACPVPVEHFGKTRSTFYGDQSYHDRWHTKDTLTTNGLEQPEVQGQEQPRREEDEPC